jgi:hypothetical protein
MSDCGRGPKALAVIWGAILCFVATPESVRAQGIQIRVVDSTTAMPLGGALVALLDARGAVVAEALTSENGFRTFFAPAGPYRIRVRRIGFRPSLSGRVDLSPARVLTVAVQSEPVVLSTIVISARTSCRSLRAETSQALATVWGEVTKALEASRLTVGDLRGIGRGWTYIRTTGSSTVRDTSDTTFFTLSNQRPFAAIDPDTLAGAGYAIGDPLSGWSYFGPDETVLLSPSFARTHCFRLVRELAEPGLIGVAFESVRGRSTPDIAGVVWIDQRTSELRRIVFRYVNAGFISQYGGGGETRFVRLPSGAWLISSWHLRVPRPEMRRYRVARDGFQENGGGLLRPDWRRRTRGGIDALQPREQR